MRKRASRRVPVVALVFAVAAGTAGAVEAQCLTPPTELAPPDGAVVTTPPSFGWTPGNNNDAIYLNVSSSPTMDPIDAVNWVDDGSHHYTGSVDGFRSMVGATLYWRLVADGCGERTMTEVRSFVVGDVSLDPYYDLYHLGWPGGAWPSWDPHDLGTIESADLVELRARVGTAGATPDRKLGVSVHVPYFFTGDLGHYRELLRRLFAAAEAAEMPILIGLDGFEWWRGRPELWNWWDPAAPGYADGNRDNVEWTSWSSADAVREGWRNWGAPFRTSEPHPNVASPVVLAASRAAIADLAPLIRDWYFGLAPERRYLLAGVKLGWEVSIGVNYFYPTDGDGCVARGTCDPVHSFPVGYAAAATAGIRSSGTLLEEDRTRAVQLYLDQLAQAAYEAGLPRHKLFTHTGAGAAAALTPYAHPGWSFYTFGAGPAGLPGLDGALGATALTAWACAEWGGPGAGASVATWRGQLEEYFGHGHNKLLAGYVGLDDGFAAALGQVLDRVDCWMHPPVGRSSVAGRDVALSWAVPGRAVEVYLNVTTDPAPSVDGGFVTVNVANERVTGSYGRELRGLGSGVYYWKLFADGCGRRAVSELLSFEVRDESEPAPDAGVEDGAVPGDADPEAVAADGDGDGDGVSPDAASGDVPGDAIGTGHDSGCGCRAVGVRARGCWPAALGLTVGWWWWYRRRGTGRTRRCAAGSRRTTGPTARRRA
jgi:hypothetical protein